MSVSHHARQCGVNVYTIYSRMLKMYGLTPWEEYTLDMIQAVSKKPKRAMKKIYKKN